MRNRSGPLRRAVLAVLLLLGASTVAASPAAPQGRDDEAGFFQRVEQAVGVWLVRLAFGGDVRGGSTAVPSDPPDEPTPATSAEPIEPPSSEPAAEDGPHWDPDG